MLRQMGAAQILVLAQFLREEGNRTQYWRVDRMMGPAQSVSGPIRLLSRRG